MAKVWVLRYVLVAVFLDICSEKDNLLFSPRTKWFSTSQGSGAPELTPVRPQVKPGASLTAPPQSLLSSILAPDEHKETSPPTRYTRHHPTFSSRGRGSNFGATSPRSKPQLDRQGSYGRGQSWRVIFFYFFLWLRIPLFTTLLTAVDYFQQQGIQQETLCPV